MNLIGKIVFHKLWGQGMIINQTKTRIIVEFVSHSIGEKVFIYPDIFRKLLKCVDNTTELYIQSLLHNKNFNSNGHSNIYSQYNNVNSSSLPVSTSVQHCCLNFEKELRNEIGYLKSNSGKHWHIFDGEKIEQVNGKYYYSFECDEELNLPSGTKITLW